MALIQTIKQAPTGLEKFATGLSTGLKALAENKINQMHHQAGLKRTSAGLRALTEGDNQISQETADALAELEPALLREYVKGAVNQKHAKQTSANGLRALIPELTEQEASHIATLTPAIQADFYKNYLANLPSQEAQQPAPQGLGNEPSQGLEFILGQNIQQQIQQTPKKRNIFEYATQKKPEEVIESPIQLSKEQKIESHLAKVAEKEKTIAQRIAEKRSENDRKKQLAQMNKEERADQFKVDKQTQKYYDANLEAEKAAIGGDLRLDRMENLVKKGDLPTSAFYKLFKYAADSKVGGTLPFIGHLADIPIKLFGGVGETTQKLLHKDVEEFEKLSADFAKDAKKYFGSRLTDADLTAFMRTIPTLAQTDYGKLKMINNLRAFLDLAHDEYKVMEEIISENNGERPKNLELEVHKRMKPRIDEVSKIFVEGYKR